MQFIMKNGKVYTHEDWEKVGKIWIMLGKYIKRKPIKTIGKLWWKKFITVEEEKFIEERLVRWDDLERIDLV